ncbi:hypothetical protein ACTFIY_012023 [Dictyostelium cf. discoideum]
METVPIGTPGLPQPVNHMLMVSKDSNTTPGPSSLCIEYEVGTSREVDANTGSVVKFKLFSCSAPPVITAPQVTTAPKASIFKRAGRWIAKKAAAVAGSVVGAVGGGMAILELIEIAQEANVVEPVANVKPEYHIEVGTGTGTGTVTGTVTAKKITP